MQLCSPDAAQRNPGLLANPVFELPDSGPAGLHPGYCMRLLI